MALTQAMLRALGCLKRPGVAFLFLLLAGGGLMLLRVPILRTPGYELSAVLALLHGLLGGFFGIAAARQERRIITSMEPRPRGALRSDSPLRGFISATLAAWFLSIGALSIPFFASWIASIATSPCDPAYAVTFFPVLTLPSALIAAATGVLTGFLHRSRGMSIVSLYLIIFASIAYTVWPIIYGPQIFAFNHFGGWLPGPLYDEMLVLPAGLWWFRLETLLLVGCVAAFGANLLDMRSGQLTRPHFHLGSALLVTLGIIAVVRLENNGAALGTRTHDVDLMAHLDASRESTHFLLYYPHAKDKEAVERIVRDLEFRYQQISTFFGKAPEEKLRVWWYPDAADKQRWVGAEHTHFAKPWRHEVHVNDSPFPHPVIKHELVHAMAAPFGAPPFQVTAKFFGLIPVAGIIEGVAVAVDDPIEDLSLHEWAAGMKHESLLPDVRSLMRLDGFYDAPPARAYAAAGSFIKWLQENFGAEKIRALYLNGDFEKAYGVSLEGLAQQWEAFLGTLPLDPSQLEQVVSRFRKKSLFQRTCAREVEGLKASAQSHLTSNPEKSVEIYQRIRAIQPEDFRPGISLAAAQERTGQTGNAQQTLTALANEFRKDPAASVEIAMAQADHAYRTVKPQEADRFLRQVLELHPAPQFDRTARVKLAGLSSTDIGPAIWQYFETGNDEVKLLLLREALSRSTKTPELSYLIARKVALQGDQPLIALRYLRETLTHQALAPSLRREATRLKLESRYLAGDCGALKEEIQSLTLDSALKRQAAEWTARCDFEKENFKGALVPAHALP